MSMNTAMIYGFGFECDTKDSILIQFIKKHKEAFCRTEWERRCIPWMRTLSSLYQKSASV